MQTIKEIHQEIAVPAESFVQFNGYRKEGMIASNLYKQWCLRGKIIAQKACRGKKAMVMYSTIPLEKRKLVWEYLFNHDRESLFLIPDVPEGWLRQVFPNYEDQKSAYMQKNGKDIAELSENELEIARARYNLVKAMRSYVGNAGYGMALKKREEFVERYNMQMIEIGLYEVLQEVTLKTLYRWSQILKEKGNDVNIEVLAPSYRLSAKNRELSPLPVDDQKLLKQLWLVPSQPTIATVYRLYEKEKKARGEEVLSTFKVRRFIQQWAKVNSAEAIYLRKGEKEMNDKVMPYIERDNDLLQFMDMIVADGHTLNFQIINKTGKLCRATLVCWVDMRSLMILGFEIMLTENTMSVVSSLRQAMIIAGQMVHLMDDSFPADCAIVPRIIYTDNGKAFKNKYFNGKVDFCQKFSGLFDRLEPFGLTKAIYALPYNAKTKVNERIFGTFLECEKQVPTYIGNSISNKPARMKRNEAFHKKTYEESIAQLGYLDLQSAYAMIREWVIEYNQRPGTGKYLRGLSPYEKAKEAMDDCKKRPIEFKSLNYMMQEEKGVKLLRNGIKLHGKWYNSYALSSLERGDWDFKVRYDMIDLSKIYVYDDTGQFLCEAERWAGQGIHPAAEYLGSAEHKIQLQKAYDAKGAIISGAKYNAKREYVDAQSTMLSLTGVSAPLTLSGEYETSSTLDKSSADMSADKAGDKAMSSGLAESAEVSGEDIFATEVKKSEKIDFSNDQVINPII